MHKVASKRLCVKSVRTIQVAYNIRALKTANNTANYTFEDVIIVYDYGSCICEANDYLPTLKDKLRNQLPTTMLAWNITHYNTN